MEHRSVYVRSPEVVPIVADSNLDILTFKDATRTSKNKSCQLITSWRASVALLDYFQHRFFPLSSEPLWASHCRNFPSLITGSSQEYFFLDTHTILVASFSKLHQYLAAGPR